MIDFDDIFYKFIKTKHWQQMLCTREDSPYHREPSVASHTRMCLDIYRDQFKASRDKEQQLLTQLAILFHDVGKPQAETQKYSEARGEYHSYGGHEQLSACSFLDYACSNNNLGLNVNQLRVVRWMVENHLPINSTGAKLKEWRINATYVLGPYLQCFTDLLLCDAQGRVCEDSRVRGVETWLNTNLYQEYRVEPVYKAIDRRQGVRTATFLIGPSGSGKSTLVKELVNKNTQVFSYDIERLNFFRQNGGTAGYSSAWNFCNAHARAFDIFATRRFNELINQGWDIIIDNTNLSAKKRRQHNIELRQHGYFIIGIEFWSSLSFLLERNAVRTDRSTPEPHLTRQYFAQNLVRFGSEVDEIRVVQNF